MKFYITLTSMFLCLCSFNNDLQAAMEQQYKCINELTNDVLDITSKSHADFIKKYLLSDDIKHVEYNIEKYLINHYVKIAKTLENRINQVKQDYKDGLISESDGKILLDYFDKINNQFKLDIKNLYRILGSYELQSFFENDYSENNTLNYGNKNLD